MNRLKRLTFSTILAITLLFSACSTDLDVIGDYKETMVVYGLLDQTQPIQYIKINKAFLGEGDALMYAQIKDSVQFVNALKVEIKRIKPDGTQGGATILLTPTNMPKDAGLFYSADQTNAIYSFPTPAASAANALKPDSEYELTITNGETGNVVTAKTSLIADITGFTNPVSGPTFQFVITPYYPNFPFNVVWNSANNARLYQVIFRLNYVDSTASGLDTNSISYTLPEIRIDDIHFPIEVTQQTKGRDFYKYIGSTLTSYSGLVERKALNVDLLLVAGSDDLSTFIDVNKPSTGIIQERPEFTNITNGLGLFSSRLNRAPITRPLDITSWDSLACGQYTRHLKFLNASGIHPCL